MDVVDFGKGTSKSDWWVKGARKNLRYTITDQDNDGAPFDLTGKTLACYIAESDNGTPVITKVTTAGITLAASEAAGEGVQDVAVVALTAADSNMRARTYRHALWITTPTEEEVLSRGDAVLSDSAGT